MTVSLKKITFVFLLSFSLGLNMYLTNFSATGGDIKFWSFFRAGLLIGLFLGVVSSLLPTRSLPLLLVVYNILFCFLIYRWSIAMGV